MSYPKASVIVPVYKVEEYLPRCLDSLAAQTYPNLEIVLVDDGSPDRCGELCDAFAHGRPNALVLHQSNQGLSAARNCGVRASHGDYITFVDSDDYISADYVEYLMSMILKYHCDISVGNYAPVYRGGTPDVKQTRECQELFTNEEALIEALYSVKFGVAAWAKMYKRELVEKYPFPRGKLFEELATTYKIIGDSASVAYGNRNIYFYVQRPGGIMSNIGPRELYGLEAAGDLLKYAERRFPKAVRAAKVRYEIKVIQYMPAVFSRKENEKYFRFLRKEAGKYFKEVFPDKKAGLNFNIKLCAVMTGIVPARIVFRTIVRKKYGI